MQREELCTPPECDIFAAWHAHFFVFNGGKLAQVTVQCYKKPRNSRLFQGQKPPDRAASWETLIRRRLSQGGHLY